MSAVLDSNSTGYKVGSTKGNTWFITALSLALVGYNAIHLHDYAVVNFINEDTGIIKEYAIRLAATGVAFLEIVIGGVFVYLYRTSESKFNAPLLLVGFLALVVASMAVVAGNGSQQSKADMKSNKVTAHESSLTVIDNDLKSAEIQRDIDLRIANQIKDANQRAIEKDRANLNYSNKVSRLNSQKSVKQSSRPVQPFANDSIGHYISITLFSILCSFGALFLSGYSAAFLKPLVAIPAITFVEKLKHAWSSSAKDFQTTRHHISPVGGFIGNLIRLRKVTPKLDSRPTSKNDTVQSPELDNTTVSANSDTSVRALDEQPDRADTFREFTDSDYAILKQCVLNSEVGLTVRPVKDWLLERRLCLSDAKRQKVASQSLKRLFQEKVLILNPEQGKTKKVVAKYVLNPDYSEQPEQGSREVKTETANTNTSSSKQGTPYEFKAPETIAGGIMFGDIFEYFNFGKRIKAGDEIAPEWVNNPDTEIENNEGVPLFTLEAEEAFRLAILTPDRKFILYDLATENIDAAIKTISGEGQKDYNQAHEDYRRIEKSTE